MTMDITAESIREKAPSAAEPVISLAPGTVNAHPYPRPGDKFEAIINFYEWNSLFAVRGDVLKTGLFFGPGSEKLAAHLRLRNNATTLFVIDDHDVEFGLESVSAGFHHVETLFGRAENIDMGNRALSLILLGMHRDTDRDPSGSFLPAWDRLSSGGGLVFDGYTESLPRRKAMIDELAELARPRTFSSYRHKLFDLFFMIRK